MKDLFKVVLKTRDADFFIRDWLRYYIRLVGAKNIIVVDDHSKSTDVLNAYKEFKVKVYKTPSNFVSHDAIHNSRRFPQLYEELMDTCVFFTIIDTDEFLCFLNYQQKQLSNENLLQYILDNKHRQAFTPPWVYNYNYGKNFLTPRDITDFNFNLTSANVGSGKVILNSANIAKYPKLHIGHNNGVKKEPTFGKIEACSLLLLHLNNSNWEAQINTKIQALTHFYNCSTPDEAIKILANKPHEKYEEKVVASYIKDKKNFLKQKTVSIDECRPTLRTNLLENYPNGNNYTTEFLNFKDTCIEKLLVKIHTEQFT